jgi:hypothetical protein
MMKGCAITAKHLRGKQQLQRNLIYPEHLEKLGGTKTLQNIKQKMVTRLESSSITQKQNNKVSENKI